MVRNAKRWTDGHASVTGTATHMTIEREARGEDGTWTVRLNWDSTPRLQRCSNGQDASVHAPAAVEGDKADHQTVFAMALEAWPPPRRASILTTPCCLR